MVKKKMYYNMRVKTMQRNKADLLFRLETERATLQAEPRNRMLKLFSAVKDVCFTAINKKFVKILSYFYRNVQEAILQLCI